jgi:hypothetical protein
MKITEKAIIVKLTKTTERLIPFTPIELYDATRQYWPNRIERLEQAELAFCVINEIIVEVYKIAKWFKAGETLTTRPTSKQPEKLKYEFVGNVASNELQKKYIGMNVANIIVLGQTSLYYVNIEE